MDLLHACEIHCSHSGNIAMCSWLDISTVYIFTRNDAAASINFTAVEGGDNSSYAGSEAREVFINTSSDISGVNK